jgi:hypothetical protein
MRHPGLLAITAALVLAASSVSCGGGSRAIGLVTIEPLASSTPPARAFSAFGGKPAASPTAEATGTAADPAEPATADATEDASTPAPPPTNADAASPTPEAAAAPTEGRWIDVDVTRFTVRLMDGSSVVREIAPVAVGAQVDTGASASTQTGLYHVYTKVPDLVYDPPYDTYISNWVGFDPDKANGFHSFLKDKSGAVVDASTGRVSNGCNRTGAEADVYPFAEIGMPVWVHG